MAKIGHLQSELAVTFGRNNRSRSIGISGQNGPEYADRASVFSLAAQDCVVRGSKMQVLGTRALRNLLIYIEMVGRLAAEFAL